MLLTVVHQTTYRYDQALSYALQRVRLTPQGDALQTVEEWRLSYEGAREEVQFIDHFSNACRLLSMEPSAAAITITARGRVATLDRSGVAGPHSGPVPLWLFQRRTALTDATDEIAQLAGGLKGHDLLGQLHELMETIAGRVAYVTGTTTPATTAHEALAAGKGVCQDHAHIFIAAVRAAGYPARYVSGYLMMEGTTAQVASHAWAEAHVPDLGWVGFDVSNGMSPDERYVRLAFGRDYRDAMPVAGIRHGQAQEQLEVHITVEQ